MACEPMALTIDHKSAPLRRPSSMAASVSAVSPDWLMASTTVLVDNWVSVAELGGDIHFHRNARDAFDEDLADHPGVRGCSAGGDDDFIDLLGLFSRQVELRQPDPAVVKIDSPGQCIVQRAHLFVDFFLHKVPVLALFGRHRIPGHGVNLIGNRFTLESLDL